MRYRSSAVTLVALLLLAVAGVGLALLAFRRDEERASGADLRRITENEVWDLEPAWRP